MERDIITLSTGTREQIRRLTVLQRGQLLTAITDYQDNGSYVCKDSLVDVIMAGVSSDIDRLYKEREERSQRMRELAEKRWNKTDDNTNKKEEKKETKKRLTKEEKEKEQIDKVKEFASKNRRSFSKEQIDAFLQEYDTVCTGIKTAVADIKESDLPVFYDFVRTKLVYKKKPEDIISYKIGHVNLLEWIKENTPTLLKCKQPTFWEYVQLKCELNQSGDDIKKMLLRMYNYAPYTKKNKTIFLGYKNWLKMDGERHPETEKPKLNAPLYI